VTFSNGSTATSTGPVGPISSSSTTAITMVNGSTALAVPGSLGPAGDSFTDTWKAA
jgi:hypothetical protein